MFFFQSFYDFFFCYLVFVCISERNSTYIIAHFDEWYYNCDKCINILYGLLDIFINELAKQIHVLNRGVVVGEKNVSILVYADDIVLVAQTETIPYSARIDFSRQNLTFVDVRF